VKGTIVTATSGPIVPAAIAQAGDKAAKRYIEFFTATIRNPNTRRAYGRAVFDFFLWTDDLGLALPDIEPVHVATYSEQLAQAKAPPTVKQHLAAISMRFDWLTTGGVTAFNPAGSVRGPKHVVKRGKTPVLTADEARQLLDSNDTTTLIGLRDRALIGVMVYSFSRIEAALNMKVADYYVEGVSAR
jgi:integrase/recombinase XerD